MMERHPKACRIILDDSYMDDISSGCNEVTEAIDLQREITSILTDADFPLRQWVSNSEELMKVIIHYGRCEEGVAAKTKDACGKFVSTLV